MVHSLRPREKSWTSERTPMQPQRAVYGTNGRVGRVILIRSHVRVRARV
jgi:hypothetical protein